jgi:hypothetical protein
MKITITLTPEEQTLLNKPETFVLDDIKNTCLLAQNSREPGTPLAGIHLVNFGQFDVIDLAMYVSGADRMTKLLRERLSRAGGIMLNVKDLLQDATVDDILDNDPEFQDILKNLGKPKNPSDEDEMEERRKMGLIKDAYRTCACCGAKFKGTRCGLCGNSVSS